MVKQPHVVIRLIFVLTLVALLALTACSRASDTAPGAQPGSETGTQPGTEKPGETPGSDGATSGVTEEWETVDGFFRTDRLQPVLLLESEDSFIYVQVNSLLHRAGEEQPTTLYEWPEAYNVRAWTSGSTLLVGVAKDDPAPDDRWLAVDLSGGTPTFHALDIFFGPEDLLEMKLVEESSLFVFTVRNGEGYSEFVYTHARPEEFVVVNAYTAPGTTFEDMMAQKPAVEEEPVSFEHSRTFNLNPFTVRVFEDERGSIVYFEEPFLLVWRYFEHSVLDFRLVENLQGEKRPFGRFLGPDGEEILSFPSSDYLSYDRGLWQEGWILADNTQRSQFFRVGEGQVETLVYRREGQMMAAPEYTSYELSGAEFVGRSGSLLLYGLGEDARYLSVFDLLNVDPRSDVPTAFDSLWLRKLEVSSTRGSQPFPWEGQSITVQAPVTPQPSPWDALPAEVQQAAASVAEAGDLGRSLTFRQVDGTWHLLVDERLYRYEAGAMKELAKLPVEVRREVGEGVNHYSAQDFTYRNGAWYVADTFGNRVLKLGRGRDESNDSLRVVAEAAAILPSKIDWTAEGHLQVTSLAGRLTLGPDLQVLGQEPLAFEAAAPAQAREFVASKVYQDEAAGLLWFLDRDRLYQYRPESGEVRSVYVGAVHNARAVARLLPYKDQVLLLFDDRLFLFDQEGEYGRSIRFDRVEPDGIYVKTPAGENTHYLDEARGHLYLVQGFRILDIDLESGAVKPLFMQEDVNLGRLLYQDGQIYVSAHVEPTAYTDRAPEYTELIRIDPATGRVSRSLLEITAESLRIDADTGDGAQLVLWNFDKPHYTTQEGTFWYLPLDELD